MSSPQSKGLYGEQLVSQYYRDKGYTISATNFRTRMGEIDIIAQKGEAVVFIEVKTRTNRSKAKLMPRETVDIHKQRRIILAAQEYLAQLPGQEPYVRFDVAEVLINQNGSFQINCIENAFTV